MVLKLTYQDCSEAYRDLRKMVDESEKQTLRKIRAAHKYKKDELNSEMAIYEGHLKENQQALDKVQQKFEKKKISKRSTTVSHGSITFSYKKFYSKMEASNYS